MAGRTELEAKIVHIVFADVVGFVRHGLESKNEIDQILQSAVVAEQEAGGLVTTVDNGDGFFLVFDVDPRRAAEAALRLHNRFLQELAVRVRIGLHSGIAFLRNDLRGGVNLTGPAVEQAQRTMSVGSGEFPLVSADMGKILREFDAWSTRLVDPRLARVKSGELVLVWRLSEGAKGSVVLNGTGEIAEPLFAAGVRVVPSEEPRTLQEIGLFAQASCSYSAAVLGGDDETRILVNGQEVGSYSTASEAFLALKDRLDEGASVGEKVWVEREADRQLRAAIDKNVSFILVRSARFNVKTTLLVTVKKYAESLGFRTVFHDFRSDGSEVIADQATCYRQIILTFFRQLGLDLGEIDRLWVGELGLNSNLERCIEFALNDVQCPVFWAWDESERLLHQKFADDLFGLLRSWHNRRAWEDGSIWSNLTIAFTYRVDARAVIQNQQQSPFNVGFDVLLQDFSVDELGEMNRQFGDRLVQGGDIRRLEESTSGHPLLVNSVFELILSGGKLEDIERGEFRTGSRLRVHLDDLWRVISGDEELRNACRLALLNRAEESPVVMNLVDLGALKDSGDGGFVFRGKIYETYFRAKFQ